MEELERLKGKTYAIEHNLNCSSNFLVRLVGPGHAVIKNDHWYSNGKNKEESKDVCGSGKTLKSAITNALEKYEKRNNAYRKKMTSVVRKQKQNLRKKRLTKTAQS